MKPYFCLAHFQSKYGFKFTSSNYNTVVGSDGIAQSLAPSSSEEIYLQQITRPSNTDERDIEWGGVDTLAVHLLKPKERDIDQTSNHLTWEIPVIESF